MTAEPHQGWIKELSKEQPLWRSWDTHTGGLQNTRKKGQKGTAGDHPKLLRLYVNQ